MSNRVTHQCRHDYRSREGDRQVEGVRTGGGHAFFCRQKAGAQLSAIGPAVELPLIVGDAVGELDDLTTRKSAGARARLPGHQPVWLPSERSTKRCAPSVRALPRRTLRMWPAMIS